MRLCGCFALPNAVIESLSNLLITIMKSDHPATHPDHDHKHGPGCGHTAIEHDGHVDYLHDGHLHHPTGNAAQVEEHILEVSARNPADCTNGRNNDGHETKHQHGPGCGHETVPHGEHLDFLVEGQLHHPHAGHCDDHGPVKVVHERQALGRRL